MKDGPGPPPMNRRRVLSPPAPPTPAGGRRRGSTLSPKVLYTGPAKRRYPNAIDATPRTTNGDIIDLTSEGYGREGLGRRRRPAGGAKRGRSACTSYNETCVLFFAKKSVLCRADDRRTTSARRLIYVFFLPKLNDGLGSELGSGEIWNAEKA